MHDDLIARDMLWPIPSFLDQHMGIDTIFNIPQMHITHKTQDLEQTLSQSHV